MKNLLLIFLLPVLSYGQTPTVPVGPGEYDCYFINSSGKLYHLESSLPSAVNVPSDLTWKFVAGGLHSAGAIDNQGHVWTMGTNSEGLAGNGSTAATSAPSQVLKDSSGKVFDNVVKLALWSATGTGILAVKGDSTLWIWGNLAGNMRGNGTSSGTWSRPVQVVMPGNRKVIKACVNSTIEVLCSDGTVWAWGASTPLVLGTNNKDCSRPQQVVLPQAAKDIACGGKWSYAVGADGTLYGWGFYNNAMFGSYSGSAIATPLDLTKYMGFPLPVSKVFVNTISSYFILTDGSLYSCGDNTVGSLGNGREADQVNTTDQYAIWADPGATNQLLEPIPTHILPGVKFVNVFVSTAYCFYFYAQDSNGQLYSAGRNKGGVLGNGVRECDYVNGLIGSERPNSWDVPTLTAVNPLALKTATSMTSPYCRLGNNQNSSPCNLCPLSTLASDELSIPGTIAADDYTTMSGVTTQTTTDSGGGKNVGWLDAGDWMDYSVNVAAAGVYTVNFRVASPNQNVIFQLRSSSGDVLTTTSLPSTGGFQKWVTVTSAVTLPAGSQTLRVYSVGGGQWNCNWMQFTSGGTVSQAIPGKIEAESFSNLSGIQTQSTTDAGGGLNVGWIDMKDWMDYSVNVATAGTYTVSFRAASPNPKVSFQLKSSSGTVLSTLSLASTGGFQTWKTVNATVTLPAGVQTLRVYSSGTGQWNLNWMQFAKATTTSQADGTVQTTRELSQDTVAQTPAAASFYFYPNPVKGSVTLQLNNQYTGKMIVQIIDVSGTVRHSYNFTKDQSSLQENLTVGDLSAGTYFIRVQVGGWSGTKKMAKF